MKKILGSNESFVFEKTSDVTVEHVDPVPSKKMAAFELSTEKGFHNITDESWVGEVVQGTKLTNTSSPDIRIMVIYKSQ